jgi:hypothetical protein
MRVRGPASHVNALIRASTETIVVEGRKEDFTVPQVAVDVPGQKILVLDSTVDVTVHIRPLKLSK